MGNVEAGLWRGIEGSSAPTARGRPPMRNGLDPKKAGKASFERHGRGICPTCKGSGKVTSQDWESRSRKGGNKSYLNSLDPRAMSMAERGKRGGSPRSLTLADLELGDPKKVNERRTCTIEEPNLCESATRSRVSQEGSRSS